jgi:NTP pyrophosphatase (non-canonical NTP hydrolase)
MVNAATTSNLQNPIHSSNYFSLLRFDGLSSLCLRFNFQLVYLKFNTEQMNDIQILITELQKFRDERNWSQFHNTKDLALAISIEAAELNELFLWKTTEECELVDRNKLKEELADVFAFSLLLAGKHGFDVKEIVLEKIRKNGEKYPVEKSKGTAKKYNEL